MGYSNLAASPLSTPPSFRGLGLTHPEAPWTSFGSRGLVEFLKHCASRTPGHSDTLEQQMRPKSKETNKQASKQDLKQTEKT